MEQLDLAQRIAILNDRLDVACRSLQAHLQQGAEGGPEWIQTLEACHGQLDETLSDLERLEAVQNTERRAAV